MRGGGRAWRELATASGRLRVQLLAAPRTGTGTGADPGGTPAEAGAAIGRHTAGALHAFHTARRGLAPWDRRVRRLAEDWQHAVLMSGYWGAAGFARAEALGAELLAGLPEQGCPRRAWHAFCTAYRAAYRGAADSGPGPAPAGSTTEAAGADRPERRGRSPLGDQVELRWRIGSEIALIRTEYSYGPAGVRWRRAATELLPWLEHTHDRLAAQRPLPELEHLAQAWRARRGECLPPGYGNNDWADLILVEHVPRRNAGLWWRLRHGHQPPPPR